MYTVRHVRVIMRGRASTIRYGGMIVRVNLRVAWYTFADSTKASLVTMRMLLQKGYTGVLVEKRDKEPSLSALPRLLSSRDYSLVKDT